MSDQFLILKKLIYNMRRKTDTKAYLGTPDLVGCGQNSYKTIALKCRTTDNVVENCFSHQSVSRKHWYSW